MAKHEEQKIREIYELFVGLPDSGFAGNFVIVSVRRRGRSLLVSRLREERNGIEVAPISSGFLLLKSLGAFFFSRRRYASF